jgi:Na+-transporting NADH:ubiquinone oxidoreductase subunit C
MRDSFGTLYTVGFATAVAAVCSVFVASSVIILRPRQEENQRLDRMENVLAAAGILEDREGTSRSEIESLFSQRVRPIVVDLETGEESDAVDPLEYDQRRAAQDVETSRVPTDDPARVRRVPELGVVYLILGRGGADEEVVAIVLPVHGAGLWGQMYGYLALDADTRTIRGIAFYAHQETPGLGAEIENEQYTSRWVGRQVTDDEGDIVFEVTKDEVGGPEEDPYKVDAITGATQTSNGLTALVRFWVGSEGYGPFLERFRSRQGRRQAS